MSDASASILETLAADYMERLRQGEDPDIAEYVGRYPHLAEEIVALLPSVAALEGVKDQINEQAGEMRRRAGDKDQRRLGDFRLIREIGRGGMGVVYEAEQISLSRRAALKVLPKESMSSGAARALFEREATLAANLAHPNIVPVFGAGQDQGLSYFAMQFIDGKGLDRIIQELADKGPGHRNQDENTFFSNTVEDIQSQENRPTGSQLSGSPTEVYPQLDQGYYAAVARLMADAARALGYAHKQGVLHRDIKPGNLMVDRAGKVWIADFGLAKPLQAEDATHTAKFMGTPRYFSPERFDSLSDERSDIYALGLVLHELLTLQPAFSHSSHAELLKKVLLGDTAPPSAINPHTPPALSAIARKASALEPDERFQTAEEMADMLELYLSSRPTAEYAPGFSSERSFTVPWLWIGLVAALLLAGFAFWYSQGSDEPVADIAPAEPVAVPAADPTLDSATQALPEPEAITTAPAELEPGEVSPEAEEADSTQASEESEPYIPHADPNPTPEDRAAAEALHIPPHELPGAEDIPEEDRIHPPPLGPGERPGAPEDGAPVRPAPPPPRPGGGAGPGPGSNAP